MPSEKEKQCMICSCICIVLCAVIVPVVVTQVTKNEGSPWDIVGDPLWRDDAGTPEGNVALSDSGERLLLVEFNKPSVGIFDVQKQDDDKLTGYAQQDQSNQVPAPRGEKTDAFLQVGSLSGDGTTMAIGYPEEVLNVLGDQSKGYVSVYQWSDNAWTLKGNQPDFRTLQGGLKVYTSGFFGGATALSQDGNRLAVGILLAAGLNEFNNTSTFTYTSYVQVYDFNSNTNSWETVGPLLEGTCPTGSTTGCVPCQGDFGPGEVDFGTTLSLTPDGSRMAVGAPQEIGCNDEQTKKGGFVRVFDYSNGSWQQVGADIVELDFNDAANNFAPRQFGRSVSLSSNGQRLAIGSNAGGVIMDWDGTSWKMNSSFKWDAKSTFLNIGSQMSLTSDGNKFAFSGPEAQSNGGRVKVYEWKDQKWKQEGKTISSSPGFGRSLSISRTDGKLLAAKGGYDTRVYQAPS